MCSKIQIYLGQIQVTATLSRIQDIQIENIAKPNREFRVKSQWYCCTVNSGEIDIPGDDTSPLCRLHCRFVNWFIVLADACSVVSIPSWNGCPHGIFTPSKGWEKLAFLTEDDFSACQVILSRSWGDGCVFRGAISKPQSRCECCWSKHWDRCECCWM